MANIVRYQPSQFLSLRDAMDRLFDESFLRPLGDGGYISSSMPAIDLAETNDQVVVTATVPGVKPEDIKIALTGDVLEISGEMKAESEHDESTYHVRERRYGSFNRAIPLPTHVVSDRAQAEFENGVLKLTLPKAEEVRPKTIQVKVKK
jgi:HSP20 family protein